MMMEHYNSTEESGLVGEIFSGIFKKKAAKAQAGTDQMKALLELGVQRERTRTEQEANKFKKTKLIVTIVGIVLALITLIVVVVILKKPK
jgi:plastocyanin domain-containing protein